MIFKGNKNFFLTKMGFMWLLLLTYLLGNCLELGISYARLISLDEVKSLNIISSKLKSTYWNNIDQTSCVDPLHSFNMFTRSDNIANIVTCNCSYSQGAVCHVTNIKLKGLNLTGVFPEEFGNLTQLQEIDLSRNYISGTIPKSLSKIPLANFSVLGNRMSGVIPDNIGNFSALQDLILEDNQFGGTLPESIGNLTNLARLHLGGNYFSGSIPETYANLTKLYDVRINGNPIFGQIPDFIGNWRNLSIFDIQGTLMQGPIPSIFSSLTNMNQLRISDLNSTNMSFPNLNSLVNLEKLVLRNCSITGQIPNYKSLSNLKVLDLSNNQLVGPIPDLSSVELLILTNNSLSGELPPWVLNSRHNVDVSYNNFTGSSTASCQTSSSVIMVSSYSSQDKNPLPWCLAKDLRCPNGAKHHSLSINCGGSKIEFEDRVYEGDSNQEGPSCFYVNEKQNWAYTSSGSFIYRKYASFLTQDTSNSNLSDIYRTARLSPLSLKYYGLCLKQGSYQVKLHFAEIQFSNGQNFDSIGRRIFDVAIQGETVLKDFNIAAKAGGVGKEVVEEFKVNVEGSTLEINLYWAGKGTTSVPDRNAYGPLINAITVTPNFHVGAGLSVGAIVGIVLASCAVLAILLVTLRMTGYLGGQDDNEEFRKLDTGYFTLRVIKAATNDFSIRNKIGEGGFGPVYKGVLPDGRVIAVKQLSSKSKQGNHEFLNEIGMISALQHPNLVKLYGCCVEGKELLLIYEYMENNCLARALFGREDQKLHLDWQTRKRICLGIARGLAYLHEESRLKIVHRDIKATNVLLDKDLTAKISDFGLAKLNEDENSHISTRIAGTIGYMAPEYATRGYLTDKADVYSFGVVVLEIVSGKSNANYRPKEDFVYLLDWAYVLQEQGNILELVDPNLGSNYDKEEALRLLNLALLCTSPSPTLRPTMSSVLCMIDGHIPIQSPIVARANTSEELRFKALELRSHHHHQTHMSSSSQSSQMQSSVSWDFSCVDTSNSRQSKD